MAKIQVILLEDVAGQGRKGEIVTVSDGYAHNFLLKNKKAVLATAEELQKIENRKKKEAKKHEEERQKAIEVKKILEGKVLTISVKSGENTPIPILILCFNIFDFTFKPSKKPYIHFIPYHTNINLVISNIFADIIVLSIFKNCCPKIMVIKGNNQ